MTVDDRAYLMHLIPSLRTEDALTLLYPTVFPISDLILEQRTAEVFIRIFLKVRCSTLLIALVVIFR